MATATKDKQPLVVGDLFRDPEFPTLPFTEKMQKFLEAKDADPDFRGLGEADQEGLFNHLMTQVARGTAMGKPQEYKAAQAATPQPPPTEQQRIQQEQLNQQINPQGASLTTPEEQQATQIQAGGFSLQRGTADKGVLSTVGGAAVKAAQQIPGLVAAALPSPMIKATISRNADDLSITPEVDEQAVEKRRAMIGRPIEHFITGEIKEPSSPGMRLLEHVTEEVVGTAVSVPLARALIPALKAGTPLTKDIIKQALLTLPAASVGQLVREAGGTGGLQMGAELSTIEVAQLAGRLYKAITNKPGMLRAIQDMIKKEVPDLAKNVETSGKVQELLGSKGYVATVSEETGSKTMANVAAQQSAEHPTEFGIPAGQRSAINIKATQEETGKLLGAGAPETLEPIAEKSKETVQQAAATSKASQEALDQAEAQARKLKTDEKLGKRKLADDRADAVVAAEKKLQDIEDRTHQATINAQQEVRKAQEQGVQLDDARLTEHRRIQDQLTREKQAAHDEYTATVRAADTEQTTVATEVRTAQQKRELAAQQQTKANEEEMESLLADASDATTMRAPAAGKGEKAVRASQTKRGESGQNFFSMFWDKTFGNKNKGVTGYFEGEYKALFKDHADLVTTSEQTKKFRETMLPGGSFDKKMEAQMRGRYESDPLLRDIDNYIVAKAEKLGTTEVDTIPLSLEDFHTIRSSILTDMRSTPMNSPRRIVQKQLLNIVEGQMETVAEGSLALAKLHEVNGRYRIEQHRFLGDTPGGYATIKNPRTGEPFHNPDHIGAYLFGPGATSENLTLKGLRNEEVFGTYLSDLDDVIKGNVLKGDIEAVAAAKDAKNRLFDSVKNEFYQVTMKEGTFDVKAADKWLKQHASLLDQSPELRRSFASMNDRVRTIQEVAAVHQGQQAQEAGLLTQAEKVGKETVREAKSAKIATKVGAQDERTLAERTADETFKERERTLEDVMRDQTKREQQAKLEKELQAQTGQEDVITAQRKLAEEKRAAAKTETGKVRELENIRMSHDEKVQALKAQADADKTHYQDLNDAYQQVFGKQGAMANALEQDSTFKQLGIGMDDWLNRTLRLPIEDQLVQFAHFKKLTGGDPVAEKTLMGALWQRFVERESTKKGAEALGQRLGADVKIAPPDAMRRFLSEEEGYGRIIKRIAPEHANNMKLIDYALQRSAELESASTEGIPKKLLSMSRGIRRINDVAVITFAHMLGIPYSVAGIFGLTTEATALMSNARKAAILKELHFNPQSAKLAVDILDSSKNITWKQAAMGTILRRAGVQNAVYQQEPMSEEARR